MLKLETMLQANGINRNTAYISDWLQYKVDKYNAQPGTLTGYNCPKCNNKGHKLVVINGNETYIQCSCLDIRKSMSKIAASGIESMMQDCTFDNFQAKTAWQQQMLQKAKAYTQQPNGWFFVGGQVGCGKTHICTAVVGTLLYSGISSKYCLWKDESARLKGLVNEEKYIAEIKKYKLVECLYIDDFFKTRKGTPVTAADVNLAFEILNYRYNNKMLTVISSEKTINEILKIDEATGSRIYQMSKGNAINVSADPEKNYRLRG